jgi:translocation and assembly module TamB
LSARRTACSSRRWRYASKEDWSRVFKEPLAFARGGADLELEIPDADLAAFARFLPSVLAPKGRLHLDASYRRGEVTGNLRLTGAATRPLGPLGVVQEVEADIGLAGDALELRSVKALSGGEEVRLTGTVALPMLRLPPSAPAEEREPRFNVALKGNNLPFVRRTGLLVRGDLDLQLNTTERGGERVTGKVRLRDSLFLQDVRGFLPSGASSRARRPPYFSVENAPLNRWRLDVNVEGEQFMRLRTTVFNGVASARFHLGGTLEEPIAIGEVVIDEGRIRLPFAGFDVREGRVSLTREQPYEPQLFVVGETRRLGYDLRMEVTGTASAPVLAFSSSPPLEHGQVLLMVMAGEAPKSEVTYTGQQRATQLGRYLGQSLLASFGGSENGDRLTITSGEKVSELGRETIEVEYQFNDRWSLTGEYDEFDDYNAGVKWRVYSRGGEKEEESNEER